MSLSVRSILCAGLLLLTPPLVHAAPVFTVNVKDFGARGDGVTDDQPALQAAINAAFNAGGGTVFIPAGSYLLNSYNTTPHPWKFNNLLIGSNVTLQGETGTELIQGPGGRAVGPVDATEIENAVLAVGTQNSTVVTFQDPAFNGGLYAVKPTQAQDVAIVLATPADAARFVVGDYIALYAVTTGDPRLCETSQVSSVNSTTGALGLAFPLARAFSSPSVARVTALATKNVTLDNLIVRGSRTLLIEEVFNFAASRCQFISDAFPAKELVGWDINTLRGGRFSQNLIHIDGAGTELPQRDSQDIVFEGNTFEVRSAGFGEYGAHWQFLGNHFWFTPGNIDVTLPLSGLDIVFDGNDVHSTALVSGSGFGAMMTDLYAGTTDYFQYVGGMRITHNVFYCQNVGNTCVFLQSRDPVFENNRMYAKGGTVGLFLSGPDLQTAQVRENYFVMDTGLPIALNTVENRRSLITGNTFINTGTALQLAP